MPGKFYRTCFSDGDGNHYDLSHLSPMEIEAVNDVPRLFVRFSVHCVSKDLGPGETPNHADFRDEHDQPRVFDLDRYKLSLKLPGILATIHRRKCLFTDGPNYMVVEVLTGEQRREYEIYFTLKRDAKVSGRLSMFVQSAFCRDNAHRPNRPRQRAGRRNIRFKILAKKVLNGDQVHAPPK